MTDKPVNPPLILVDGSSYLYRAYHVPALQRLTRKNGEPSGAIYGVANMLRKLLKEYQPTQMAVVFDAKGKTFRHEQYPEYKANRPPMPDDLRTQIEPLHSLVRLMGLPMIVEPGVEADDVIGTLASQASEQGIPVLISTGDKDLAQLVNEHVTLINTMTDTVMDSEGVKKKFGVPPDRMIDFLTLTGDKSDNIPGVDKVGPKTAEKWLQQYDSLENLLQHSDEIKGKVGENLRAAVDQIPLSRELVTIQTDLKLHEKISDLAIQAQAGDELVEMLQELDFRTWLKEIEAETPAAEPVKTSAKTEYTTILDQKTLDRWFGDLKKADLFALDTETTSLDYMQAEIVGLSFSITADKAAYLPLMHDYPGAPQQLDRDKVFRQLKPLLEDPGQAKLGHNLKYDRNVLLNHGIELRGIVHDSMLESYVMNSTANRHDMDTLCEKYLGHQNIHYEDVAGKGAKQITFNLVGLEEATPYAAEDADMTWQLHQYFWPQLKKLKGQRELYESIEIPLLPVLSRIERNGVLVDADALFQQSHELSERMAEVEREVCDLAGQEFNLGSPKQLQKILFEDLGLPVIRKTPKGQPSTAEDVLQELANDYPLPRLLLEHRSISKLKSTYTDKLPLMINADSGRVHTSYHQAVASTGRLSSTDPNLQNIPIRTEEGRRIRQAFIAPPGCQILAVDYSQIELRIMAHLSGDQGLQAAFAQGLDIHRATAAEVFGGDLDAVTTDQRRAAKAINFGLIYGMSAFGLGKQLGIGRNEAQEYVDLYFARYPGVKEYMDNTRELARQQGYVETLFGRRLYLPEIKARNAQRRQYAERTAINAPMQGTAADIIKRAMISVDDWLGKKQPGIRMIMQVHDELVFEVEKSRLAEARKKIVGLMEHAANLKVPLIAEAGVGSSWNEAH